MKTNRSTNRFRNLLFYLLLLYFIPANLYSQNENSRSTTTIGLNFSCNCPNIVSETVATQPENTTRTKLAVGEEVILSLDGPPSSTPSWQITSGGGEIEDLGNNMVMFTASDTASISTIQADISPDCQPEITFTIVAPDYISYDCPLPDAAKQCYNIYTWPLAGFVSVPYIQPTDVSFYRIEIKELADTAVLLPNSSTFWENSIDTLLHPEGMFFPATQIVDNDLGTKMNVFDAVQFGAAGNMNSPGTLNRFGGAKIEIPMMYKILENGTEYLLPFTVLQQVESTVSGDCEVTKEDFVLGFPESAPTIIWTNCGYCD